jgi:hypothetical protein
VPTGIDVAPAATLAVPGKYVFWVPLNVPPAVNVAVEQTTLTTGARDTYVLLPVFGSGGVPESVTVAVLG